MCQSPSDLLPALAALQKEVLEAGEEGISFRKHNTRFDKRNETTQLLNAAAEQLWNEKQAMEQSNFEEHASDFPYLCQHFKTSVNLGLTESVRVEKFAELQMKRRNAGFQVDPRPRRFFGGCCSSEFPPQQGWWLDISQRLVPKFQVLRTGKLTLVSGSELVPGDIVYLSAGERAVVDCRILVVSETSSTAVDVSHLTSRANDVRSCSSHTTAASAVESRNVILKDSHVVSGSLFCMVVRTPLEPFVSSSASSGLLDSESSINTAVPVPLSLSTCQSLFKTLCVKTNMFCKGFRMIDSIRATRFVVVLLTQSLAEKGNVSSFCSVMQKLKKIVVFVTCGCNDGAVDNVCKKLGVECTKFEASEMPARPKADSDIDSNTADPSLFTFPAGLEPVAETENSQLMNLLSQLRAGNVETTVIKGISQAALVKLCRDLGNFENPLLYVMSEFHYPNCFRSLAVEGKSNLRSNNISCMASLNSNGPNGNSPHPSSAGGISRAHPSKISLNASHQDSARGAERTSPTSKYNSEAEIGTASKATQGFSNMVSTRTDPAPHIGHGQRAGDLVSHIFIAVDSIGIVSSYSDCVLLKPDLGCLGAGLEMITKKLGR